MAPAISLTRLSPIDFYHPDDRKARAQLEAVPGLAKAVKAWLSRGAERSQYGLDLADKVRLGPRQLPEIYRLLPPLCEVFGIAEPRLFLEAGPVPNAYVSGVNETSLTITTSLLAQFAEDEVEAVLAHECGHIACEHVLYLQVADRLRSGAGLFYLGSILQGPFTAALLAWSRRCELSADRAAAAYMGAADPVVRTMLRLAGGDKRITESINIDAYLEQANEYAQLGGSKWELLKKWSGAAGSTHPHLAVRTKEILDWCETEPFQRIASAVHSQPRTDGCWRCARALEREWRFCKHCGAALQTPSIETNASPQYPRTHWLETTAGGEQ
jgi:Zn-dependent protease with chaperone function